MSRRPANVTQANVARAIRAARQAGAGGVEVRPDGSIFIHLTKIEPVEKTGRPLAPKERPVL
jgi:hypothetical protein